MHSDNTMGSSGRQTQTQTTIRRVWIILMATGCMATLSTPPPFVHAGMLGLPSILSSLSQRLRHAHLTHRRPPHALQVCQQQEAEWVREWVVCGLWT